MKHDLRRSVLAAGILVVLNGGICQAGDLLNLLGHGSDCGCSQSAPYAVPMVQQIPAMHVAPVIDSGCACSGAVSACCGVGGGMMQLGSLYGSGSLYGHQSGSAWGGPAPGSFLSGYEGLPNMDGGGIHHRYPYHSYRRPWAHPGTPSTNVTIVW